MTRKFTAAPVGGFPGFMDYDDSGTQYLGLVTVIGEIFEPGESPEPGLKLKTLAQLKSKYLDQASGALRVPLGKDVFVIGPEIIAGVPEDALVLLQMKHQITGEKHG